MAVSVDPFTKTERTLYYEGGQFVSDGSQLRTFHSNWVNIDNRIGIIAIGENNEMAFGDRQLINSIQTARLYPAYSNSPRQASQVKRKFYYFTGQTAQGDAADVPKSPVLKHSVVTNPLILRLLYNNKTL